MVARLNSMGEVVEDGDQVEIGGNDKYVSLCRQHWLNKDLGGTQGFGRPAQDDLPTENNKGGWHERGIVPWNHLHHKDGYDVHPIIKDGGVKIGGEVVSSDEAIVKALLAGGATRGTNDQGQGNGNYRMGSLRQPIP